MSAQPANNSAQVDPRVYLAAERTLLAWIRTGIAMMAFGFVVDRFGLFLQVLGTARSVTSTSQGGLSLWLGTALILGGVIVNVLAAWQHVKDVGRLKAGEPVEPKTFSMSVLLSALLGVLGLVMAAYVLMLG